MSLCDNVLTVENGKNKFTCRVCGEVRFARGQSLFCKCKALAKCLAGCRLTRILKSIGIEYTPGCGCEDMAREMDIRGAEWCRENTPNIVAKMRSVAHDRKLDFSERGAKWLVNLAIRLAEKEREPNRIELIVLGRARKRIARYLASVQ